MLNYMKPDFLQLFQDLKYEPVDLQGVWTLHTSRQSVADTPPQIKYQAYIIATVLPKDYIRKCMFWLTMYSLVHWANNCTEFWLHSCIPISE
jgi:hypothetical protein